MVNSSLNKAGYISWGGGKPLDSSFSQTFHVFDRGSQLHSFASTSHIHRTHIRRNAHGTVTVLLEVPVFETVKIGTWWEKFRSSEVFVVEFEGFVFKLEDAAKCWKRVKIETLKSHPETKQKQKKSQKREGESGEK